MTGSDSGLVATFGGAKIPSVTAFMEGYAQGVKYHNEKKGTNVEVIGFEGGDQGSFTGGFAANDEAKGVAAGIIDQGVDVILPVGGPIYQSAMDAIADSGRDIALIGVDADFFGRPRDPERPTPGPFERPGRGEVALRLR